MPQVRYETGPRQGGRGGERWESPPGPSGTMSTTELQRGIKAGTSNVCHWLVASSSALTLSQELATHLVTLYSKPSPSDQTAQPLHSPHREQWPFQPGVGLNIHCRPPLLLNWGLEKPWRFLLLPTEETSCMWKVTFPRCLEGLQDDRGAEPQLETSRVPLRPGGWAH